jgi:hypothetical protein
MFEGGTFCIIEYGIELAPKRAGIVKDIISKNKGTVVELNKGIIYLI